MVAHHDRFLYLSFSDESEPNFFRMFGSGFKNEPSPLPEKYRFTRHSFPEYRPDPTPARSKRRPAEDIFSLKERSNRRHSNSPKIYFPNSL